MNPFLLLWALALGLFVKNTKKEKEMLELDTKLEKRRETKFKVWWNSLTQKQKVFHEINKLLSCLMAIVFLVLVLIVILTIVVRSY